MHYPKLFSSSSFLCLYLEDLRHLYHLFNCWLFSTSISAAALTYLLVGLSWPSLPWSFSSCFSQAEAQRKGSDTVILMKRNCPCRIALSCPVNHSFSLFCTTSGKFSPLNMPRLCSWSWKNVGHQVTVGLAGFRMYSMVLSWVGTWTIWVVQIGIVDRCAMCESPGHRAPKHFSLLLQSQNLTFLFVTNWGEVGYGGGGLLF